jgi:hypothetical protein
MIPMRTMGLAALATAMGLAAGALVAPPSNVAHAAQQQELDPRVKEWDKGPATIDVSAYPPEMQARYELFIEKCGKCHTPARAINADLALEDEWERFVKRKMRRTGTFIKGDEAKELFEFLVYDSKVRKHDLYEQRLKESTQAGAADAKGR